MYLNSKFIKLIFSELGNISNQDSISNRQVKVSQIRYLFAVSFLIKKENLVDERVDLTPSVGAQRASFKAAVGEIVKLNDQGLYTQDFKSAFQIASDYKTGNNFLTTLVRWTGPYPGQSGGRDGPVLQVEKVEGKNIAFFHPNFRDSLQNDYNLEKIKAALAIWLCRFSDFSDLKGDVSESNFVNKVNSLLTNKFDSKLAPLLLINEDDFGKFLKNGNTGFSEDLFSESRTDLAFLVDLFHDPDKSAENIKLSKDPEDNENNVETYCVVFSGPPGTGKTRCARVLGHLIASGTEIPSDLTELQSYPYPEKGSSSEKNIFTVQFHPSYSYEDFMEGLKPVSIKQSGKSDVAYEVVPGIFRAAVELARSFYDPAFSISLSLAFSKSTSWQLSDNATIALYKIRKRNGIFYYGNKELASIEPETNDPIRFKLDPDGEGNYKVTWRPTDPKMENIVLVIDEFNRGDPAVIFGEALSLLEKTKRIDEKEEIEISLPYSGTSFKMPPNFHVLATMNTSDRTLSSIDMALKRRFRFVYLKPNFALLKDKIVSSSEVEESLIHEIISHFRCLNESLDECAISLDQQIGHSYAFMLLGSIRNSVEVINDNNWQTAYVEALKLLWRFELHQIVRDIIGSSKLEKFSKLFVEKIQKETDIRYIKEFPAKKFYTFLEDPAADHEWLMVS